MTESNAARESPTREVVAALVVGAAHGEAAVITRHGKPRAAILGVDEGNPRRRMPSFGRLLLSSPPESGDLLSRDTSPSRDSKP